MIHEQFLRTQMLLGTEALEKLQKARVAVFGIGGVGGYAVEALARTGIGTLGLVDDDVVDITNLNRQLLSQVSLLGVSKANAAAEHIGRVNPAVQVEAVAEYIKSVDPTAIPLGYEIEIDTNFCTSTWEYNVNSNNFYILLLIYFQDC